MIGSYINIMSAKIEIDLKKKKKIVLVGNPNVGKSVIFNTLTGKYVAVSNYPGTTVEITEGLSNFDRERDVIIDSPGVISLIPKSEDERVARDILLEETPDAVVQVADAKNIYRGLFITIQLIEMGIPFVLALNMMDEAEQRGVHIDHKRLQEMVGVHTVPTVAIEKKGISRLIQMVHKAQNSNYRVDYGDKIEHALRQLSDIIPDIGVDKRFVGLSALSGDITIEEYLLSKGIEHELIGRIKEIVKETEQKYSQPLSYVITVKRKRAVDAIVKEVEQVRQEKKSALRDTIGKIAMSPLYGIPVLIVVLFLMYIIVGVLGAGVSVDFLEGKVFNENILPFVSHYILRYIPFQIVQEFFIGTYTGAPAGYTGYGIINMGLTYALAIVLPIVAFFFLFFGILEDSGYLPRLTIMSNKMFKKIGLNGKAILPMVLGLGCVTMATLTTRILDTKRERIIATFLLALGIPCSAQLGVIMAMLSAVSIKALVFVFIVVLTQLFIVGYCAAKILPGKTSDFIVEIPPMRVPKLSNILKKTASRVKWYLTEAVPIFMLGAAILFVLDKVGVLRKIEQLAKPIIVTFLGLPAKATEAFLIGFFRRDYGAAGLLSLEKAGELSHVQIVVSMVVITLFVPCIANLLVIIKEQGIKRAFAILGFIIPYAIMVGGIVRFILVYFNIRL